MAAAALCAGPALSAPSQSLGCLITPSTVVEVGSPAVGSDQPGAVRNGTGLTPGQAHHLGAVRERGADDRATEPTGSAEHKDASHLLSQSESRCPEHTVRSGPTV